jgi:hypothetical protein
MVSSPSPARMRSMSLATFTVDSDVSRSAPYSSTQAAACAAAAAAARSISSAVSAKPKVTLRSSGSAQVIGLDCPTPRGSKPMTSNRSRTSAGRRSRIAGMLSMPDAPGPPGFTSSTPMRSPVAATPERPASRCERNADTASTTRSRGRSCRSAWTDSGSPPCSPQTPSLIFGFVCAALLAAHRTSSATPSSMVSNGLRGRILRSR